MEQTMNAKLTFLMNFSLRIGLHLSEHGLLSERAQDAGQVEPLAS